MLRCQPSASSTSVSALSMNTPHTFLHPPLQNTFSQFNELGKSQFLIAFIKVLIGITLLT